MQRRKFLQNSSLIVAGTTCTGAYALGGFTNKRYKIGLQLFTVRDAMAEDPEGTLIKLKQMGYEDFETYGFDPQTNRIYGYEVAEFKALLDRLQLTTTSGHYGFSDYFDADDETLYWFVDRCIKAAKTLNSRYITWPWVHPDRRNPEGFQRLAILLNRIGQQVFEAGLGFAYHNHGYEFEDWDGQTGFDILVEKTNPKWVKWQMDMYWVVHSGKTPIALVNQDPGRFVMWHIKDMDKETRDYTELGNGSIDYVQMLPEPERSGMEYYYLEQGGNFAVNSMQSVFDSMDYFKKYIQAKLQ